MFILSVVVDTLNRYRQVLLLKVLINNQSCALFMQGVQMNLTTEIFESDLLVHVVLFRV